MYLSVKVLGEKAQNIEKASSMLSDLSITRFQWLELKEERKQIVNKFESLESNAIATLSFDGNVPKLKITNDEVSNMVDQYSIIKAKIAELKDMYGSIANLGKLIARTAKDIYDMISDSETDDRGNLKSEPVQGKKDVPADLDIDKVLNKFVDSLGGCCGNPNEEFFKFLHDQGIAARVIKLG